MSFRIDGLASGIDTEALIESMMTLERLPITNMQRKQQELETQKNAWRDINTRMRNLVDKFTALKLESTYVGRVAKTSQEGTLRASAGLEAVEGTYKVNVERLATASVRYNATRVDDVNEALGAGTLKLEFGTETLEIGIEADWSLRDLVNHINGLELPEGEVTKPLPMRASIVDNRLVLTSKETGEASQFKASITGTSLLAEGDFVEVAESGQDALLAINGITGIKSSSNTLKDVVQGVTLDLVAVGETTVTVSQDTQQVVDRLQEFVDQYNSTIDFINDKLKAQSAMDSNSTRGILSGDATLMRLQSTLRSMVAGNSSGDSKYNSLASIGIGTAKFVPGAADYSGKLTLDKAKLEAALKEDPLAVKEILYKVSEVEEGETTVSKTTGVLHTLESYVRGFTRAGDGILTEKDKSYDNQIKDIKDQIEKMERRLEIRSERLQKQFVAMETALATMQSQGDWLAAQLGQLNNMYSQPRNR